MMFAWYWFLVVAAAGLIVGTVWGQKWVIKLITGLGKI